MTNPLLETSGLPRFTAIHPEHVEPAVDELLRQSREAIEALLSHTSDYTWDNLVAPLEAIQERLHSAWSPVSHMNAVVNSDALRQAVNNCLPKLTAFETELGQDERLYNAYRQVRDRADFHSLSNAQQASVDQALRDFHLSGVALPAADKQRFAEIAERLSQLSARFSDNLLDATHAWHLDITDAARISGVPDSARGVMRQNAEAAGAEGWRITLDMPVVQAILTHADDRDLRYRVYEAFTTRASEVGPNAGTYDNGPAMREILALRQEQAALLGFDNYAQLSLEPKMAESVDQVRGFLDDLADRACPAARREFDDLSRYAHDAHGIEALQAWDVGYYGEKLRQARHAISPEDLRPYFPVDRTIDGLFGIVERLYGVRIEHEGNDEVWHSDVRFYTVRDADGSARAHFYMDLYARANKRGGAWLDICRSRHRRADRLQLPVAYLTCNVTPPVGDDPALLSHDEVQTLFHEFGHGLHHMLTEVDTPSVAGISGVAWDAVELPSQLMENWTWEREALDLFAAHYETGDSIPEALFERLQASRNFQAAMRMARQLEFSLFDLRLHAEYDPQTGPDILTFLEEVRERVAVVRPPAFNRFPNTFGHIFAGPYAAGYYSYKWAEVLSADAYARFEEEGLFNTETGRDLRERILAKGGSQDAMALFRAFRGREPSIEPLLRHSGLAA
jgi:oligopeptidase A